jgi:transposase
MPESGPYVGMDVSKAHLDVASSRGGRVQRFANDAAGQQRLVAWLAPQQPALVVCEATGRYHDAVARALAAAGVAVAVVNPKWPRAFAQSRGQLAKTDAVDARLLAAYAQRMQPEARPLLSVERAALEAVQARRQQLVDDLAREKQRLSAAHPRVQAQIAAHIAWLEEAVAAVDEEVQQEIAADAELHANQAVLETICGIGRQVATTLVLTLPELGQLSGKEIAKLVGLAPFARDSGGRSGARHCAGGRAAPRKALYQAALSACQHHPTLAPFAARLRAKGKESKQMLVAVARKLLVEGNAKVRDARAARAPAAA